MNEPTTTTIRDQVREAIEDMAQEIWEKRFQQNYHFLRVESDGELKWGEDINSDTQLEREWAGKKRTYWTLGTTGCGSNEAYAGPAEDVYEFYDIDSLENEPALTISEWIEAERAENFSSDGNMFKKLNGEWMWTDWTIKSIADADADIDEIVRPYMDELNEIPVGFFSDEEPGEEWEAMKD